MNKDPILKEVRQTRLEIEKECQDRGESFADYVLRTQRTGANKLVFRNKPKNGKTAKKRPV
jgi:hypothetical protein